ncbi:MAG: hypothetical protein WCP77_05295 [Roseococcus sp.]
MRQPATKRPVAANPKAKVTAPAPRTVATKPKAKPKPAEVVPPPAQALAPQMTAMPREKPAKAASKGRTEPLNFRVTADFRRAFKRAAAAQDCKKVELLERLFTEWTARNPA